MQPVCGLLLVASSSGAQYQSTLGASVRADTGYHCSVGIGAHCCKQPVLSKYWLQLCCASGELLQVVSKRDSLSAWSIVGASPSASRQCHHGQRVLGASIVMVLWGPLCKQPVLFNHWMSWCQSRNIVKQHTALGQSRLEKTWYISYITSYPKKHMFCDYIGVGGCVFLGLWNCHSNNDLWFFLILTDTLDFSERSGSTSQHWQNGPGSCVQQSGPHGCTQHI